MPNLLIDCNSFWWYNFLYSYLLYQFDRDWSLEWFSNLSSSMKSVFVNFVMNALLSDAVCAWPTRWRWGRRSRRKAVCSVSSPLTTHLPALSVVSASLTTPQDPVRTIQDQRRAMPVRYGTAQLTMSPSVSNQIILVQPNKAKICEWKTIRGALRIIDLWGF